MKWTTKRDIKSSSLSEQEAGPSTQQSDGTCFTLRHDLLPGLSERLLEAEDVGDQIVSI